MGIQLNLSVVSIQGCIAVNSCSNDIVVAETEGYVNRVSCTLSKLYNLKSMVGIDRPWGCMPITKRTCLGINYVLIILIQRMCRLANSQLQTSIIPVLDLQVKGGWNVIKDNFTLNVNSISTKQRLWIILKKAFIKLKACSQEWLEYDEQNLLEYKYAVGARLLGTHKRCVSQLLSSLHFLSWLSVGSP